MIPENNFDSGLQQVLVRYKNDLLGLIIILLVYIAIG